MKNLFFALIVLLLISIISCADSRSSGDATSDAGEEPIIEVSPDATADGGIDDVPGDVTIDDSTSDNGTEVLEGEENTDTTTDNPVVNGGTNDESDQGEDATTDSTGDAGFPIITPPEPDIPPTTAISKIVLGNASNIVIQPSSPSLSMRSVMRSVIGSVSTGLKTSVNGELIDIAIEGGFGKTPLKGYAIKGANLLKAAVTFKDGHGDITTCLIDQNDICTEIDLNPQKSSKFGNASYFIEKGGRLIYRTEDRILRSRNITPAPLGRMMSVSGDITSDLAEDVEQFEVDASGDIMYESVYGDVTLRRLDGTEDLMDGGYWDGRNRLRLDAYNKKFFIGRSDRGFTFYTQENYFGNLFFDSNGDPVTSHAQSNDFWCYMGQVESCPGGVFENGIYSAINTNKSPSNCDLYFVGQKNLVVCLNEVFELGSATIDIKKIDFIWTGHESPSDYNLVRITASRQYLYYYSHSDFNGLRLTRVDLENHECVHLFSDSDSVNCSSLADTLYSIRELTVTPDNTLNFCGTRDGIDYIVQIIDADTENPITTEIEGECDQIVSF